MNLEDVQILWGQTLRSSRSDSALFDRLADAIVDLYRSGDVRFRQHIKNRFKQIQQRTGVDFDPENFDVGTARVFVADEIGFTNWNHLISGVADENGKPILFHYAIAAMDRGDFSALESMVGGPERFDDTIIDWYERRYFENETETLAEVFSAACMLGHERLAAYLLDNGVDPYAGMKTGLSGFHYAASGGRLSVIALLIERGVPMEVKNMYGGTVFEQAIWSAVNEWTPEHAAIVELLVKNGAAVDDGYIEWWDKQNIHDTETKRAIAELLSKHSEFQARLASAKQKVSDAESSGSSRSIADSLKALGNVLRRVPFTRDSANAAYARAAELYRDLGLPLEEAWIKRHIGINCEYANRLQDAEMCYDEALSLYRDNAKENTLDYANTVRYPAVIKNRLGKREESARLWEEAARRYEEVNAPVGVAEAAAWLTIFAIEGKDLQLARSWFAKANDAADKASDVDTFEFISNVRERLEGVMDER